MKLDLSYANLTTNITDEDTARELIERHRWPDGPVCPHCGSKEAYRLAGKPDSKRPVRKGVLKCKACRRQFTVTVGTIFEGSHIPLTVWLQAIALLCSSKKGISAHQLHRMLGITYKSAWFMAHRIRYGMMQEPLRSKLAEGNEQESGDTGKRKRGKGKGTVEPDGEDRILIQSEASTPSDATAQERSVSGPASDTPGLPARKAYHGLLRRGIVGVYHHISRQHLRLYLHEFDFRHSARKMTDQERTTLALRGFEGKRLQYRERGSKFVAVQPTQGPYEQQAQAQGNSA